MKTLRLLSNLLISLLLIASLFVQSTAPVSADVPVGGPSGAAAAWETIAAMDFEGAFPGSWITADNNNPGNPQYMWGPVSTRPHNGTKSGWPAARGAKGSVPTTTPTSYPPNLDTGIGFGPFSLVGATDARLTFWVYLDIESNNDSLKWLASNDGGQSWAYGGLAGSTNGWQQITYDLKNIDGKGLSLLGEPDAMVAITFQSNGANNNYEGAYIDDIVLEKQTGGPACYTLATIAEPAGAGSITASPAPNCGANQYTSGTVVTLTAKPNGSYTFHHWSDGATGSANPVQVTMNTNRTVTANFRRVFLPAATR